MGEVWRAAPAAGRPGRRHACSTTGARTPGRDLLRHEIRAAGLDHPGIVIIIDHGVIDARSAGASDGVPGGGPYLVMELLDKRSARPRRSHRLAHPPGRSGSSRPPSPTATRAGSSTATSSRATSWWSAPTPPSGARGGTPESPTSASPTSISTPRCRGSSPGRRPTWPPSSPGGLARPGALDRPVLAGLPRLGHGHGPALRPPAGLRRRQPGPPAPAAAAARAPVRGARGLRGLAPAPPGEGSAGRYASAADAAQALDDLPDTPTLEPETAAHDPREDPLVMGAYQESRPLTRTPPARPPRGWVGCPRSAPRCCPTTSPWSPARCGPTPRGGRRCRSPASIPEVWQIDGADNAATASPASG